jgi:hypothetical protein
MITIETFERGSTPRHRPTGPMSPSGSRHVMTTVAAQPRRGDNLAHILDTKAGHFDPAKFKDKYELALRKLVKREAAGKKIEAPEREEEGGKVIDLMQPARPTRPHDISSRQGQAKGRPPPPGSRLSRPGHSSCVNGPGHCR